MAGSREVAALLDEEGAITARFEQVLREIFSRYATPIQQGGGASSEDASQLSIKPDDMARFGRDTNGSANFPRKSRSAWPVPNSLTHACCPLWRLLLSVPMPDEQVSRPCLTNVSFSRLYWNMLTRPSLHQARGDADFSGL